MSDESFEKNVQGEQEEQVNSENRGEQENLIEQQSIEAQEVKKDLNDQKDQPDQKIQEGQEAQYMQSQTNSYSEPNLQDGQSNGKKPNTLLDILLGLALSAAAYFVIWLTTAVRMPVVFILLVDFVVLVALGFLSVRFLRRGHKPAGTTMIILISPAILGLLIFGACAALFAPFY